MPGRIRTHLLLAVLLASSALCGQRRWVVDAANGPGTDFTDLPPALQAAKAGDTIVVRKGRYKGANVQRAITILGEPGAVLEHLSSQLHVHDIPLGATCTISGLAMTPVLGVGMLLQRNKGTVVLDGMTIKPFGSGGHSFAAVAIKTSAQVVVNGCLFTGKPGVQIDGGSITISGSTLTGVNAVWTTFPFPSAPGLVAKDANVTLAGTSCTGGSWSFIWQATDPGSPAIQVIGKNLVLTGDAATRIVAGQPQTANPGMPALLVDGATAFVSPDVTLVPKGNSPAWVVKNSGNVMSRATPSLTAVGAAPGGKVRSELFAQAGSGAVLFGGAPGPPVTLPWGDLLLVPATPFVLDAGVVDASRRFKSQIPIPNVPQLFGLTLGLQALVARGAQVTLSTAVAVVLH